MTKRVLLYIISIVEGDRVLGNKKGQALVEYVLIIAVISVIAVALVNYFGGYLKDSITKTSCSLIGDTYVAGQEAGKGYCKSEEAQ